MELKERELKALWNAAYVIQEQKNRLSCPELKRGLDALTKAIWAPRQKSSVLKLAWSPQPRLSGIR